MTEYEKVLIDAAIKWSKHIGDNAGHVRTVGCGSESNRVGTEQWFLMVNLHKAIENVIKERDQH